MTDGTKLAVGLSVGTTALAAVTSDRSVCKPPVFTANGVTIADFVDRVGDPVGIVGPDGLSYRAERVLADALRDLAHQVTGGRPLPAAVAIPAHWRPAAVDALRAALARVPQWSRQPPMVLPDTVAALTALDANPGLPARGVIAVCDFGGSGTSITLVDAGSGNQRIGATVRDADFSGDLVDQAVLTHVIGELAGTGAVDLHSTSAIGSLWRLRAQCRGAKERLSTVAATALPVQLPEFRGEVRLTRTELDAVLREPLAGFLGLLDDTLQRNGIHPAQLSAVASVGGGAGIAAVTTTLSEHLRVPVVTRPPAALLAATGAALRALRGPADDAATALAAAAPRPVRAPSPVRVPSPVPSAASTKMRVLAWSEDPEPDLEVEPLQPEEYTGLTGARPELAFEPENDPDTVKPLRWYRSPLAVMVASIVVILAAIGAVGVVLTNDSTATSNSNPVPSISNSPPAPAVAAPVAEAPPVPQEPPVQRTPAPRTVIATPAPPRTVIATPAPRTRVVQQQAPPPAVPPPVTSTVTQTVSPQPEPEPVPVAPSEPPPADSAPPPPPAEPAPEPDEPTPPRWIPTIPPIPTIPGLPPFLPQPGDMVPQP